MLANSTHISNRIFNQQRTVVLLIAACFVLLLMITAFTGHRRYDSDGSDYYSKLTLLWQSPEEQ